MARKIIRVDCEGGIQIEATRMNADYIELRIINNADNTNRSIIMTSTEAFEFSQLLADLSK